MRNFHLQNRMCSNCCTTWYLLICNVPISRTTMLKISVSVWFLAPFSAVPSQVFSNSLFQCCFLCNHSLPCYGWAAAPKLQSAGPWGHVQLEGSRAGVCLLAATKKNQLSVDLGLLTRFCTLPGKCLQESINCKRLPHSVLSREIRLQLLPLPELRPGLKLNFSHSRWESWPMTWQHLGGGFLGAKSEKRSPDFIQRGNRRMWNPGVTWDEKILATHL